MTELSPSEQRDLLMRCEELCDVGFAAYSRGFYGQIAALLRELPESETRNDILRLTAVAEDLVSPRFAYPHIRSACERLRLAG